MNTIKAAVIGNGFIGTAHIEAIRRLGFAKVVAIAGSNLQSAQRTADTLGIPRAYGDYRALLEDKEIQVVHNCTPNHLHHSVNLDIIRAGKHIISEKPLAVSRQQTSELLDVARRSGIVHAVCFNYRQYPMVQHLKALLARGSLGDIRIIRGSYLQDWLSRPTDYNWRIEPNFVGPTRAVGDIGSHWMDIVQYVTGQRIVEVFADLKTVLPVRKKPRPGNLSPSEVAYDEVSVTSEDYGAMLFRFSGGAIGSVTVSQVTPGRKNSLVCEIDCSESSVVWNQEESERLLIGHRHKPNEVVLADPTVLDPSAQPFLHYPVGHNQGWPDGMKNMMAQFYRFISDGKDPHLDQKSFATFEDGHCIECVLESIVESSQQRHWVKVAYDS